MARVLHSLVAVDYRLLIVDDEEPIAFSMQRYFVSRGFEVDTAADLEDARALLDGHHYAAVIADLRLGGTHGVEGLEIVAYVHENCPDTRSLLLTAYGSPEIEAEARSRGADVVVLKPRPLSDLAQIVLSLVEGGCEKP